MISTSLLVAAGLPPAVANRFVSALDVATRRFDISSPRRFAAFLGQCRVESGDFTRLQEGLSYSTPARLMAVYPSRFRTVAAAMPYLRNPEALANHVYANRLGNGDGSSGDGWRYAGKGLIQLTGRSNYARASSAIGLDYVSDPDRLLRPLDACLTAAWFFADAGCVALADAWRIDDITRAVNGPAMLHADIRREYSARALRAAESVP